MTSLAPRRVGISNVSPATLLLPAVAVTALLWFTSENPIEAEAGIYAFLLFLMPWGSYLCWRLGQRNELPLFAMVAGAYWVYFAFPLFWGSRAFKGAAVFAAIAPRESAVTTALLMALIGVSCLWLGMRIPVSLWVPAHLPDIVDRNRSWTYVQIVLVAGVGLSLNQDVVWMFGAEARQIMFTLTTVVPGVAFVLLLNRYLDGVSSRSDRIVLVVCAVARLVIGLASGWLGPTVALGVTCGALVLLKRRTFPWKSVLVTTALLLFLQVGKSDFRSAFWSEGPEADISERVEFWLVRSASLWGDALTSGDFESARGLASQTVERASLLMQVAHVGEMTPSQVPFQEGATYRFMAVTLIPRLLWPDKPSINEANRFYQVAYGLTTARGLEGVSIAVGALAEGFINFGWVGVIGIMLLIGLVLGMFQRTFAATQSSTLFLAVGLTLVPGFLSIDSQLGQYFGGVIQQAALSLAVFLPFASRRAPERRFSARGRTSIRSAPAALERS